MDIGVGNPAVKRRLWLELAGEAGAGDVAREVRKCLAAIGRSHTFVNWENRRPLVDDLEAQRDAIVDRLAKADAPAALDLMWRFLGLANSVFERCDDSSGTVIGIFRSVVGDLCKIAQAAKTDPRALVESVSQALLENDYCQYDGLIQSLTPVLGQAGLEHLKQAMLAVANKPVRKLPQKERQVIGWGSGGSMYADEVAEHSRRGAARGALRDIVDAQGDVDAFIAQYDEQTRKVPKIAAAIARRLLTAGRAEAAWQTIEAAEHRRSGWPDLEWEDARIEVLEALGRGNDAQDARWSCFARALSAPHLRAYLKRLPEFDDFEDERDALEHAQNYPSALQVLSFLISGSALDRAAALVIQRIAELDGDHYEILGPAADALTGKYPLAATLLLRAMIDFSLSRSRTSRYRHAARHLMGCASLAAAITDFGAFPSHDNYVAQLRREHGKKSSFWRLTS